MDASELITQTMAWALRTEIPESAIFQLLEEPVAIQFELIPSRLESRIRPTQIQVASCLARI